MRGQRRDPRSLRAARRARAASTLVAATANIGWPANWTRSRGEDRVVVLDRAEVVGAGDVGRGDDGDDARGGADRARDRARRGGRARSGSRRARVQRARAARAGRRCRAPRRRRAACADSCGSDAPTIGAVASCGSRARCGAFIAPAQSRPRRVDPRRRRRVGARAVSSQKRRSRLPRHGAPVRGGRAHVVDRREVARERGCAAAAAASRRPTGCRRAAASVAVRAHGRGGHAAEGDARCANAFPVELEREAGEDRRDVLVEALGDLVGAQQQVGRGGAECADRGDELAGRSAVFW